jgi:hypothetical protein
MRVIGNLLQGALCISVHTFEPKNLVYYYCTPYLFNE